MQKQRILMEALLLPARETWEQIVKWMRIGLRGDAREQDRRGTDRPKGIGSRRGERMRG